MLKIEIYCIKDNTPRCDALDFYITIIMKWRTESNLVSIILSIS